MSYRFLKVLKVIVIVIVAATVMSFVVMHLWNWLVPGIFGFKAITFVQALGLLVLSKILFGGFHRHAAGKRSWKRRMEQRWGHMTAEERERFRAGMRRGCRFGRGEEPSVEKTV